LGRGRRRRRGEKGGGEIPLFCAFFPSFAATKKVSPSRRRRMKARALFPPFSRSPSDISRSSYERQGNNDERGPSMSTERPSPWREKKRRPARRARQKNQNPEMRDETLSKHTSSLHQTIHTHLAVVVLIFPATSPDISSTNVPEPSVRGMNLAGLPRRAGGGNTTRLDFAAGAAAGATTGRGGAAVYFCFAIKFFVEPSWRW